VFYVVLLVVHAKKVLHVAPAQHWVRRSTVGDGRPKNAIFVLGVFVIAAAAHTRVLQQFG
jgi:hypothetical protein